MHPLAGDKADTWYLRQHPAVLKLKFKKGISRPERDNAIDLYLRDDITENEEKAWLELFAEAPRRLTKAEKDEWIAGLQGVSIGSDAFFPFRDNIDRAYKSGVRYCSAGGSLRDEDVLKPAILRYCHDLYQYTPLSSLIGNRHEL